MPYPMSHDRRISRFYDYWNGLRQTGSIPAQDSIDPVDLAPLLPFLWVVRWDEEARDFVYRLAGESILRNIRQSIRHKPLGAIYEPDVADALRRRLQQVCSGPYAYYGHGQIYGEIGRYGIGERLILPLVDEKGRPRLVIGCTVYATTNWPLTTADPAPKPEAETGVYTTLDGTPVERIREAG